MHCGSDAASAVRVASGNGDYNLLPTRLPFQGTGGLYKNPAVAKDVTVLMTGTIPDHTEPVTWVREHKGGRVFYTSLGHPDDFKDENFIRLLVNAVGWTTKTKWN